MATQISVIAVGRLGNGPEEALVRSFTQRLPWPITIHEIDDRKAPAKNRKAWEAAKILERCPKGDLLIALDERGKTFKSREFANWIESKRDLGHGMTFIIGGPDGIDSKILKQTHLKLAFGAMTWPHKLVRVMLFEQIYRAITILTGHPYHRD